MSEDYGSDFISISDEEGNSYELEHLDTIEYNGAFYLAFLPADMDEDDKDYGMVILKTEVTDGEEYLVNPPEDELDAVYDKFMQQLFNDDAED